MYLLDTNVLSELRKKAPRRDPNVSAWAASMAASDLYLSVITVFELEVGVRRVERRDPVQGGYLRKWIEESVHDVFRGRILPLDADVAACAARLQVPDPRPDHDCFIAASALVHNMTVATRNIKDFEGMPRLPLVNPWGKQAG